MWILYSDGHNLERTQTCMHPSMCCLHLCPVETPVRHDHSKTGSFCVRSRFCSSEYENKKCIGPRTFYLNNCSLGTSYPSKCLNLTPKWETAEYRIQFDRSWRISRRHILRKHLPEEHKLRLLRKALILRCCVSRCSHKTAIERFRATCINHKAPNAIHLYMYCILRCRYS